MGSAKETERKPAPDTEVDKRIDKGVEVSDANEESGSDDEESGYVVVRARPSSPTSSLVSFQAWRDGVDTWMAKSDAWRNKTDDKLKALTDVLLETRELVRSLSRAEFFAELDGGDQARAAREEAHASESLDTENPEEREDLLAPEVPAPPEIKEDDDDEEEGDEEESKLSKSGKELKKLLGRSNGLNDSDGDEEDDGSGKRKEDEEDDDDEDDEDRPSPVLAPKLKDPKEEASDSSPAKSAAGKSSRGTPTSKSAKGKRKNGDDTKAGSGSALKKIKSESDVKPNIKEESSKTGGGSKITPSSAQGMAGASSAQGPVKEEEIRAVLLQRSPLTTSELVGTFKARLKSPEDKKAFADILKRISKIQKTSNNQSFVVLRK